MAPMEPAKADAGLSRESLQKELESRSLEELQEMGKRLARSQDQFQEMLEELQGEKRSLQEEKQYLNDTITMMMEQIQKLNIGAGNTVEPMLDEGPLDFVGRFWEKVKPRNTGYAVSEHVGEIRKPGEEDGSPHSLQEQSKQVVQRLQGALGPIWQRAEGLVKDAKGEIAKQVAERQKQRSHRGPKEKEARSERKRAAKASSSTDGGADASQASADSSTAASSESAPAPAPASTRRAARATRRCGPRRGTA
mmetsp:Transcript_7868/g.24631  ORF Transcript_7868/g.24631 Transcript_7868/m.24631 type:complete len:251 (-) Transcript_7868:612-1364(-)